MIEAFVWLFCIGACLGIAFWLKAPPRSVIWRVVKLWGEDNEAAALVREVRRAERRKENQARKAQAPEPGSEQPAPLEYVAQAKAESPKRGRLFGDSQLIDNATWRAQG
jgi:hypothetical protein